MKPRENTADWLFLVIPAIVALLWVRSVRAQEQSFALAAQDLQRIDADDRRFVAYLTTEAVAPEHRTDLAVAIAYWVASTTRQPQLALSVPQPVAPPLLYRIDLGALGWRLSDWRAVLDASPYPTQSGGVTLVRADWLLVEITDADESESKAYYRLSVGTIPSTRPAWLSRVGVSTNHTLGGRPESFGRLTANSGVAVNQQARWVESFPATGNRYAYGTRDFFALTAENDPLERADARGLTHDGEEYIVEAPNGMQLYLLSAGDGARVDKAPANLVQGTRFRDGREIRNPGSCAICHAAGLNPIPTNEVAEALRRGALSGARRLDTNAVRNFHLRVDINAVMADESKAFQQATAAVTGLTPAESVAAFVRSVERYDAALDLAAAARELNVPPAVLQRLIAGGRRMPARFAGLAVGRTVPRDVFSELYQDAQTRIAEALGAL